MKQINILVLDDSFFMRESLSRELERDINIKVVAKASDAYEARDMIIKYMPDFLIADINMERLNGIEFIKNLLPQYYLPVICISSDKSFKEAALKAGAIAFVPKPEASGAHDNMIFFADILIEIKKTIYSETGLSRNAASLFPRIIAFGASTGGAEALNQVLSSLPPVMPPIVIAQHMPAKFTTTFAARLNGSCKLSVKEGQDGDILIPGQVYIAPGGCNSAVKYKSGRYVLQCSDEPSSSGICPSADVLLSSVAAAVNDKSIGIILTGMGRDGAEGLKKMKDSGARTIVQDEATSVVYGMPKAAFEIGAADAKLPLNMIAQKIISYLK